MKIMLLVSSMGLGGAERVAATLCNAWAERGDKVLLVATYSQRGEIAYSLLPEVQVVHLADMVQFWGKAPYTYLLRLLALRRLIAQTEPDVVVSFLTNVNIGAILATRGLGTPTIVCERTNPIIRGKLTPLYHYLRRRLYPCAEIVTVQSGLIVDAFRKMIPRLQRVEVVSNPVPAELTVWRRNAPRPGERKRLVAMGRLSHEKQFGILIDVFGDLATRFPSWDLWIWGEGPLRAELEEHAKNAAPQGRVFFPGSTKDPWTELGRASVFVLVSAYEGFPNVLLEAMAIGTPCVTFDCQTGPRELSRDGRDAILVPMGDAAALSNGLARMMEDESLRLEFGRRARLHVSDRYSLSEILARWDQLFESVRTPEWTAGS